MMVDGEDLFPRLLPFFRRIYGGALKGSRCEMQLDDEYWPCSSKNKKVSIWIVLLRISFHHEAMI